MGRRLGDERNENPEHQSVSKHRQLLVNLFFLLGCAMNITLIRSFTLDTIINMTRNTSLLTQAHYLANFTDSLLPVLVLIVTQPTQVSQRKVHRGYRKEGVSMLTSSQPTGY